MKTKTLRLAWEKVGNAKVAVHKSLAEMQVHKVTPRRLQVLAMAKMKDVMMISCDFSDDPVFFYPCVCLMFESRERVEFIGTYRADLSDYTDPESPDSINGIGRLSKFPTLCVRRAFWDKRTNSAIVGEFRSTLNKKDYILGDVQTKINVAFIRLENFPVLETLISDSTKLIKDGITFQYCSATRTPYYQIHLTIADKTIADKTINFNLLYDPNESMSNHLDDLTNRWQRYLVDSPLEESIIPDEDVQISYERSLFDCLRDFELLDSSSS